MSGLRVETKSEWGPRHWNQIHTETIRYPVSPSRAEEVKMRARLVQLVTELPCPECRKEAIRHLMQNPPATRSTYALRTWGWRFHNAVNARLGKPQFPYESFCRSYADELARADAAAGGGWVPRPRARPPARPRPRLP
jgi:hypothetical protein